MRELRRALVVAGIVIGTETVSCGGIGQAVGIAMIADEILGLRSESLGGAIGAALSLNGATFGPPVS
jgi:hypothetical protein